MKLKGKCILVTGASRGIGAAIATQLASEGAQVGVTFSARADAAEKVLASLSGSGHSLFQLNLTDEKSVESAFEEFLKRYSKIDGLVNNAGITKDQLMLRMKSADFDEVIQTNLRGTFLCTKAVLKPMMKARYGSIVHITSVIGQTGNAGQANYAASKAGIEAFSRSIAKEMASRNLRSNCVAPGFIETEMTHVLTDQQKAQILSQIPLERIGSGQDVALATSFLLSDESKYITGHTLSVNGGMFMN